MSAKRKPCHGRLPVANVPANYAMAERAKNQAEVPPRQKGDEPSEMAVRRVKIGPNDAVSLVLDDRIVAVLGVDRRTHLRVMGPVEMKVYRHRNPGIVYDEEHEKDVGGDEAS